MTVDHPNRPRLQFSPPTGWMNDPNGLIRVGEVYHLYYQHNPGDVVWGDLHWGHASSTDLCDWTHHPVAIAPDRDGQIFSGTVVVDPSDSAGFGPGAWIAAYTNDLDGKQTQALAWSRDGFDWTKYEGNPVLVGPPEVRDFRDPKLLPAPGPGGEWTMALAVGEAVEFHRSADLRTWRLASRRRLPLPPPGAIVEVPELIEVPVEGTDERRWVLIVSVMPPHGVSGRRTIIWVSGDFDGDRFEPAREPRLVDEGVALYAAMAWDLGPDEGPVLTGWLDDGPVRSATPRPWRGRLCVPRRLRLRPNGDAVDLVQTPVLPADRLGVATPIAGAATVEAASFVLRAAGSGSVRIDDEATGRRLVDIAGDDLDLTVIVDQGCVETFAGCSVTSTVLDLEPGSVVVRVGGDVEATLRSASPMPNPQPDGRAATAP